MCWVKYLDMVYMHQRQSILLGLALTEETIPLKITPRSSCTNQDVCVLYYKIFSFPPPACLPYSLSVDYHLATWKFPEDNYLAAIQDIHKNCTFLWQVAVLGSGRGMNTRQVNCAGSASALALLLTCLLLPTRAFAPLGGLAGALCFSGVTCSLLDWFFLPPELWQVICCVDDAGLCMAGLLGSPVVWLGLTTSAGTWWQFC